MSSMSLLETMSTLLKTLRGDRQEQILTDRRSSPRKPCDINGIYTCHEGNRVPLRVKNIGRQGIHVQSSKKLVPGSHLLVSQSSDTRVSRKSRYDSNEVCMTVLWSGSTDDNHSAGLKFNGSPERLNNSWLTLLLNAQGLSREAANYRRSNIRVSADIPLTWRVLGSEYERTGNVLDISFGGALIATDRQIQDRENLWLKIGPHKSFRPIICRGTIVRTSFSSSAHRYLSGICFDRLDEEQSRVLGRYLSDIFFAR